MSMIQVSDLSFTYPGSFDPVFEHVNLTLDSEWRLGLIGRNGRGKTTFLRLLTGAYAYSGQIQSKASFVYFPYAFPDEDLCASELLAAGDRDYEEWRIFKELALLDTDPELLYRPFATLSSGEKTKVMLAALFSREHPFLLIDEPTNHLDSAARQQLAAYLQKKSGFILVSHDRELLDACTDHTLAIGKAGITLTQGNFSVWYREKQLRDQAERMQNKKLQGEIARLEQGARQASGWSDKVESTKKGVRNAGLRPDRGYIGHKSAKMMRRAKNLERRLTAAAEEKAGLLKDVETAEELKLSPLSYRSARLAVLQDVRLYYGERQVCGPVRLTVEREDRICLWGKNGCGKSSLLKLFLPCAADRPAVTGLVDIGAGLVVSHVPQDAGALSGDLANFSREQGIDRSLFYTILRKLGFSRTQLEKNMAGYSAGQKKKVLLAASLCRPAHLYIWDEPLNYIDLESRMQIEALLLEYRPTLLFVEHDRAFARNIATKTLEL